jgi:hypothetical protein
MKSVRIFLSVPGAGRKTGAMDDLAVSNGDHGA